MLNASPLNSAPLNGVAGQPAEPEYIVRGQSFVWALRVTVDGVDWTGSLTGTVTVDREEGAAGVAGFDLFLGSGPVVPTDWIGKPVTIDYISTSQGVTSEVRRFTGQLSQPTWSPNARILGCECSDQLQQRVEAMPVEAIDSLTGGYWSADVFEPVTGRSRWDYAVERMGSRPASLDCSPAGAMRVTSWYATNPHFEFGEGTTVYDSVDVELAQLGNITNRVEIEFSYRYPRLQQLTESFSWTHPHSGGVGGMGGFCAWRTWSTELPDTNMIESAITGAGLTVVGRVGGFQLPLSMSDPCGDGSPWLNTTEGLWLSASVTGARRWTQTVTESYTLTLTTTEGQIEGSQRISRDSTSFEIESSRADDWDASLESDPSAEPGDLSDESRRAAAIHCLLRRGQTEIIESHRGTTVSWVVPTSMASTVDLVHTLSLNDQGARAIGKCRRILDSFDLNSGEALTTLSIAVMRGGGVSDPILVPGAPDTSLPPLSGGDGALPTQLGGRQIDPYTGLTIPPFDETRTGFAGNYSVNDNEPAEIYPRRFDVEARDIPAEYRDEQAVTAEATYLVGIPNDLLEL